MYYVHSDDHSCSCRIHNRYRTSVVWNRAIVVHKRNRLNSRDNPLCMANRLLDSSLLVKCWPLRPQTSMQLKILQINQKLSQSEIPGWVYFLEISCDCVLTGENQLHFCFLCRNNWNTMTSLLQKRIDNVWWSSNIEPLNTIPIQFCNFIFCYYRTVLSLQMMLNCK